MATSESLEHISESLRQREQQLSHIFDTVADVIYLHTVEQDGRYRFTSVNQAFYAITGLVPDQVIGKRVDEIIPQPSLTFVLEKYQEAMRGKRIVRWEETSEYPTGRLVGEVSVAPVFNDAGVCTHLVGAVHDVTERKRNEEALRKAEEEYRAIFENATEGIFKSTPDGRFLLANPAMARIHGYDSPAELITSVTDIQNTLYVNPSRRTELVQALQQHGYVSGFKIEAYRKDRSVIWISMNAHAVKDKAGNILYWQGTIEDITERTRLEQQLRQADKLIAVGTLVSGIAHEVVNPLSGALGRADLLLRGDLQGSLRDDVQVIRDEVERGLKILRNLLFFARGYKPEKTYISVNTCLENALVLRAYSHQVDNIHLQLDLQPDLPATLADPNQLQQLFLNLIINAEQAMVEANGRGTLSINSRQKDNAIRVTVADDGPGIPPQTLARLFEPFFTTKPVGKGTGLGLSICYGIAQEHGGAIHVASEVGKGAAFTVELPLVAPPGPGVELGAT